MEQGVAGVEDPMLVRLEDPGNLRVAEAVDRRDCGGGERADLDRLPRLHDAGREPELLEGLLGRRERDRLESLAHSRRGAQHDAVRRQRARQRRGVGVVEVKMGDERERDGARLGCQQGVVRRADVLLERADLLEQVDHGGGLRGLDLESGPAQAADAHHMLLRH
jgi:hypothetical protein